MEKNIVKLNETSKEMVGRKQKAPNMPTISVDSQDILDQIYAQLGGVHGSILYWRNHEDEFRQHVESKFLTKQVLKEAAKEQGKEVAKNIFMTFIQNNGLTKQEPLPQVEATIVNPELEEF